MAFENPDGIGYRIPILYDDALEIVPVPNDEQELEGALEIGTRDAISSHTSAILNKSQVQQLISTLQQALKDW